MVLSIFGYSIKNSKVGLTAGLIFASLLFFTGGQSAHAAADTCTWTGAGADTEVTTAGNWSGCDNGNVPENGDNLIFPDGPVNKTVLIDSGLFFNNVTFSGSSYSVSALNGTIELYVEGDLTISGNNNTFVSSVRLFPTTSSTLTNSGTGNTVAGDFIIQPEAANTDLILDIQSDILVAVLAIAGSYDVQSVTKTGSGTFEQGNEAVTGLTVTDGIEISEGSWKCNSQFCLGDDSNVYNIAEVATLEFAQPAWINIGSITGEGTISITNADARILLGSNDISGTFSGTVEGYADSVIEIIGGTWTFTGTNTDVGNGYTSYYINGGTMLANASDSSLGSSPFSMSAGVLGGNSTIGETSIYSGILSPGNSPGCMTADGNVAFSDSSGIYNVQIQGEVACTGYDRLTVDGIIYLNNATLDLEVNPGLPLTNGHVFTIMSADAIDGTFTDLTDGSTVTVGAYTFRINYTASAVTLTYVGASAVSTATDTPDLADTGANQSMLIVLSLLLCTGAIVTLFRLPFKTAV